MPATMFEPGDPIRTLISARLTATRRFIEIEREALKTIEAKEKAELDASFAETLANAVFVEESDSSH